MQSIFGNIPSNEALLIVDMRQDSLKGDWCLTNLNRISQ
jgi:hypothetical protein